ncbi:unnamed protein product [Pieris macdunnoughi]|uniref:Uncharacterized protein n=2 Tax=Pieris TaxID=7115 RepID=A0A9P0TQT5_PIEBR|nr:unnamed protein product [Pieris macdunnoughi]CAH4034359.1 unnamed protein product [Pieris brassicae]
MNCQAQQQRSRRRVVRSALPMALARRERERRDERYAAAKWEASPHPTALPIPPNHWFRDGRCRLEPDHALPLKLILNVTCASA